MKERNNKIVKVQVSVTPSEAKRLIAKAVSAMPAVRAAMEKGKILLKGGTTVSAVSEELVGLKIGISGRITKQGAKRSGAGIAPFHRLLIDRGEARHLDTDAAVEEVVVGMGKEDVLITGANALDMNRRAALMVGRALSGPAAILPTIAARGIKTIVAVGWEKLIPCPLEEAVAAAGNQAIDMAMGMAVGLIPLNGVVVTETDAVRRLTGAEATVIGAGGVMGAEGSTTFVIEGEAAGVKKAWELVRGVKGAAVSGIPETLEECEPRGPFCNGLDKVGNTETPAHRGCAYFMRGLEKKVFGPH